MKKTALVTSIAEKSGLTRKQADDALAAFIGTITETLKAGDDVQIVGFGTFGVRERKERKGHSLVTGEPITIPASKSPYFKPGKTLKDAF